MSVGLTPALHAAILLAACGLATWAAIVARGRHATAGSGVFATMMFAIAYWALVSALHTLETSTDVRVMLAQFQYLAIATVAPLWLVFAGQYTRSHWLDDRTLRVLLWIAPVLTIVLAFTNDWHHLLWTRVEPINDGARLRYVHGPWFWVAVAYSYIFVAVGTVLMFRALSRFPPSHRRQRALVMLGALLPWAGNIVYVAGWLPPGFDATPIAFAASGVALLWGFYRYRLLDLVPIARDLVINSMDQGVVVIDQQRQVVDTNNSAERLMGIGLRAVGQAIEELLPWWSQVAPDEARAYPVLIPTEERTLECEVMPVRDARRRFAGWVLLARDVTARQEAEEQRRVLERHLLQQQKLESLSVLAGGVAHDFNNVLTTILGNADLLLLAASQNPALRNSADAIIIGAQRAADLVSKMLAYSGEGQVISQIVNLDHIVTEMLELLQASAGRHCTIEYRKLGTIPPIRVDPTQLRQIIVNLIVNASEAVDDGGRIVVSGGSEYLSAAALAEVTFRGDAAPGQHVFIEVTDSGHGMDAETLARIFDPFFSTKPHGRGLGLAAVQGIVRSHRGALHVQTKPGEGSTFRVWLPVAAAPERTAAAAVSQQSAEE